MSDARRGLHLRVAIFLVGDGDGDGDDGDGGKVYYFVYLGIGSASASAAFSPFGFAGVPCLLGDVCMSLRGVAGLSGCVLRGLYLGDVGGRWSVGSVELYAGGTFVYGMLI